MTAQEAIDYFLDPTGKREQRDEAIVMAMRALGMQIKTRPMKSVDTYNKNIYKLYCPTCGEYIAYGNSRVGTLHRFTMSTGRCGYCGQAIDWGEDK